MKAYRTVEIGRELASLTFDAPEPPVGPVEFLTATLRLPDLVASTRIYMYSPGGPGIAEYFEGLAADWRGWDGERVWNSIEGEFRHEARHNRVGYVALIVRLRKFAWSHNEGGDWEAAATIAIEPGHLAEIAGAVAALLAGT
jgi:hypothetical protein